MRAEGSFPFSLQECIYLWYLSIENEFNKTSVPRYENPVPSGEFSSNNEDVCH